MSFISLEFCSPFALERQVSSFGEGRVEELTVCSVHASHRRNLAAASLTMHAPSEFRLPASPTPLLQTAPSMNL